MEPYLGFLHFVQVGKHSLVCDLQESYRYFVDDFVVQFCRSLKEKDFGVKSESVFRRKKGKREYLRDVETKRMMKELEGFFESKVDVPLMRHGKKQKLETLVNEEALLFAKYLRNEKNAWIPRICSVNPH
jgi:CRISPR/Cas system-associated endonuclease Cas1